MHLTLTGPGLLVVPIAFAASATAFMVGSTPAGDPREGAPPPTEMVEMEVVGVAALDDDQSSVLVLREKKGSSVLPIFVGRSEGTAIDLRLHHAAPLRPLTHDLFGKAIEALGARVVRIEIDGLKDAIFRARIFLAQGERKLELDARPSDSVALALGAQAPIFASRRVIADAGLSAADLDRMKRRPREDQRGPGGLGPPVSL